mmetsp:Transcript_13486/g.38194  ORF Transcript_13486/g.38194 Transcript_13486/m.38194 type:complete len:262 (-) Transcript_13486:23-808(-)
MHITFDVKILCSCGVGLRRCFTDATFLLRSAGRGHTRTRPDRSPRQALRTDPPVAVPKVSNSGSNRSAKAELQPSMLRLQVVGRKCKPGCAPTLRLMVVPKTSSRCLRHSAARQARLLQVQTRAGSDLCFGAADERIPTRALCLDRAAMPRFVPRAVWPCSGLAWCVETRRYPPWPCAGDGTPFRAQSFEREGPPAAFQWKHRPRPSRSERSIAIRRPHQLAARPARRSEASPRWCRGARLAFGGASRQQGYRRTRHLRRV